MSIPQEFIQDLKSRTDIADIISGYVNLKKSGRTYMGLCPFHGEKTPSFSVSPENGFFHCFGCGEGGDVITFIKKIENLDYVEAIKFLAQKAGLSVPEDGQSKGLGDLKKRIYEANREAARFFYKNLYSPEGKEALEYLRKRQLTDKTITHFGLGYSPKSRFELLNYLKGKGFSEAELIQANLAVQYENKRPIDRFSDRVMFPIIDLRGNVIGFGGRIMSDIKPKYLNTAETPAFNKSRNLFALRFAKQKAQGQLILVEGYMDVIALHQAGFENTVATLGTALTQDQAAIIKRYCDEVVICYDADEAGQKATQRAISILRPTGLNIKIVKVPDGKDPDEFIKAHGDQGPARFRLLLERSGNDVEYRFNKLHEKYSMDVPDEKIEYLTEAAKMIATLENSIERDYYISKLSQEQDISKSAIAQEVGKYLRSGSRQARVQLQRQAMLELSAVKNTINTEKRGKLRAATAEETLLCIIMTNPDTGVRLFAELSPDIFATSLNRRIYQVLKSRADSGYDFTLTDISGELTDDEMRAAAGMLAVFHKVGDPMDAARECIDILRDEAEKLTPEQISSASDEELMKELARIKKKKQ